VDQPHLRKSAATTWDTLKKLNEREGLDPADDRPPRIWFRPMTGPSGELLTTRDYFGKKSSGAMRLPGWSGIIITRGGWERGIPNASK
jgi:hypothetical protein